jgi:membrane-associated phospholipid phosphatase
MTAAAFLDLPLSRRVFRPDSGFVRFFAAWGTLPSYALALLCPAMTAAVLIERLRAIGTAQKAALGAITAALAAAAAFTLREPLARSRADGVIPLVMFAALLLFAMLTACALFRYSARTRPEDLLGAALIGAAAFYGGYLAVAALKVCWGRQRFLSMADPAQQFTAWFLPQGRAASDAFMSFPSGHAFAAMSAVWFAFWPRFAPVLRRWRRVIFALALMFAAAVMASRVSGGSHFLSDVAASAILSLASFAASRALADRCALHTLV